MISFEEWHKEKMQNPRFRFWYYVHTPKFWLIRIHLRLCYWVRQKLYRWGLWVKICFFDGDWIVSDGLTGIMGVGGSKLEAIRDYAQCLIKWTEMEMMWHSERMNREVNDEQEG